MGVVRRPTEATVTRSSGSDLKDVYRGVIAAISEGDADRLDALLAPDLLDHNPVPGQAAGSAGFTQWMSGARSAFPDLTGTVEAVLADGDLVAGRVIWRGTQRGEFLGLPPSGTPVAMPAFHVLRVSSGRVVEWWGTADLLGAALQLGARITPP
jgi:steroid delta-isomerase-like uncharacterized protein